MIFLGSLLAFAAAFTLIIGALAWARQLPGNKYIGIKVPEVRKSKEVWDTAHQFAGPLWVAAGVSLAVASAPPFSGVSWLLLISLIGTIAAVYFFGLGASIGARTAGVMEATSNNESDSDGCCGGAGPKEESTNASATAASSTEPQDTAKDTGCSSEGCGSCTSNACNTATNIDLDALKRAAQSADQS